MILTKSHQSLAVLIGLGGLGVYGLGYLVSKKAGDAANTINPLNNDNVFYRGASGIVQVATGDEHQTFGGWVYDITHRAEE